MFNFDDLFSHKIMNKKVRGDRVDKKYIIGGVCCIGIIVVVLLFMAMGDQNTASNSTTSSNDTTTSNAATGTQIQIDYSGSWSGSYSDESGTQSIDGTGSKTINASSSDITTTAVIQKSAGNSKKLTVNIIKDGNVVATKSTTAEYGVVTVTN